MKTLKRYRVYRYWPVDYCSVVEVEARSEQEAERLALENDDYSDAHACDGSEGPTEVGRIEEI